MPTTINLRNLSGDLIRSAKIAAAVKGITLKAFVVEAVEQAIKAAGARPVNKKPRRRT